MIAASLKEEAPSPAPSTIAPHALRTSIVIVAYNGGALLADCLDSIFASEPEGCEVIVVDNGSTDGSVADLDARFPHVRLLSSHTNRGFGGGANLGARAATGEVLLFLNQDCLVTPGWLEPLVAALEESPRLGLVTPRILLRERPDRLNTCGNEIHLTGLTLCRGLGEPAERYAQPEEVGAVSGAAFAIRRSLFETLGGFDEDFFMYMEDTDLSLRARLAGYDCRYLPDSQLLHDYALRFGPRKLFYQERNRYLMLLHNLRWRTLFLLLPALLLAEGLTWGFVLLRERTQWRGKVDAYRWLLTHRASIRARHRAVQATRRRPDRELLATLGTRLAYEQTGDGAAATLAHTLLDPLFALLKRLLLLLVRW